jgi:hypothetical protein
MSSFEPMRPAAVAAAPVRQLDDRLLIVLALAWGAAFVHVEAAIEHLQEYGLFALFFALLATTQFCWGVALYRSPSRRLLIAGATLSLAVLALWIVSRTTGLPIGPTPWAPEPVGVLDLIATGDEVVLALIVAMHLLPDGGGVLARGYRRAIVAAALCLILLSSLALTLGAHAH